VAKSIGSQNPYNMIRATIDGLKHETSPRSGRGVVARKWPNPEEAEAETVEA
jgi:small subunit ribosomal protein S5